MPFVQLYTNGIRDVNYIYYKLPLMFCIIQLLSWGRYVSGNLTGIAGYAKVVSIISLLEAVFNVVLSVIFVQFWGIVGVLLATVIALPIKVVGCIYISDVKILKRSCWKSLCILGTNYVFFAVVVYVSNRTTITVNTIGTFCVYGVVLTIIFGVINLVLNILVNRDCLNVIKKYLVKR